jgi:hypothetical protein
MGKDKFYFTFAAPSILLQDVAFRAGTLVTAFCVFADKIAGFGSLVAFIQIYDQRHISVTAHVKGSLNSQYQ